MLLNDLFESTNFPTEEEIAAEGKRTNLLLMKERLEKLLLKLREQSQKLFDQSYNKKTSDTKKKRRMDHASSNRGRPYQQREPSPWEDKYHAIREQIEQIKEALEAIEAKLKYMPSERKPAAPKKPSPPSISDIFEGQDYGQMFNPIKSALEPSKVAKYKFQIMMSEFEKHVRWARTYLKRSDRIHWYLRLVRIGALVDFQEQYGKGAPYHNEDEPGTMMHPSSAPRRAVGDPGTKQAMAALKKLLADYEKQFGVKTREKGLLDDSPSRFEMECRQLFKGAFRQYIKHFVAMGDQIPELKDVKWGGQRPSALIYQLTRIENDWKEKQKLKGIQQAEDKTFIQFPDGWRWVLLDRAFCSVEGDAMGHCGNTANWNHGDRILSLREPLKTGWKPHATFIINDGVLGEMKGRFNKKPGEELHPYIIALLKNDIVTGIQGGGHDPSQNFSFDDLTQDQRKEVHAANPDLWVEELGEYAECEHDGAMQRVRGGMECEYCGFEYETDGTGPCDCNYDWDTRESNHVWEDDGYCRDCGAPNPNVPEDKRELPNI